MSSISMQSELNSEFSPPVIDIGGLRSREPGALADVVEALRQACTATGFFYISNHGVDSAVVPHVLGEGKRFFDQPAEIKERIGFRSNRGYDGMGKQVLDVNVGGDMKESVLFGTELPPDHPLVLAGLPNHIPNPWPEDLPGWRESVYGYFQKMDELARLVLNGLALSLKLPGDFFEPYFNPPMSSVRLLHYPPPRIVDPSREVGCATHTDWELITILAQDGTGGLEIQLPSGEWIPAKPIPDTFIVNLGDMMARWTNDFYTSTPHRVMNRSVRDRYSATFFCCPAYYTRIESIPSCTGPDRPSRFAPTTCGEHLAERFRQSYGDDAGGQADACEAAAQ